MTLITQALQFAAEKHDGMVRRGSSIPYITHPVEAASIVAELTDDEEVIAAALLHDVMEDCGVLKAELEALFGARVAELVSCETNHDPAGGDTTWCERKMHTVESLEQCCREAKMIALGDKLSNMRAIARDFDRQGSGMFGKFHEPDIRKQAWYYKSCTEELRSGFEQTIFWQELHALSERVFSGVEVLPPD